MDPTDFFGFDPTHEDAETLPVVAKGIEDEAYDALNDETFGAVAEAGDWEGEHEQLMEKTQGKDDSGSSLFRSILVPNGSASSNFSPNTSFAGIEHSPVKSPADHSAFLGTLGHSIWTEPSLVDKMTKSFNTPAKDPTPSSNLYNFLLPESLNTNVQQNDFIRQAPSYLPPMQQQQQNLIGGVDQSNSVQNLLHQIQSNQQHQPMGNLNMMLNNSMTGGSEPVRHNMNLPFSHGKIKSVTDLENELRLQQQVQQMGQVKGEPEPKQTAFPAAKQLQPFFSEEQEAQQIEKDQLLDIEGKKDRHQHHNRAPPNVAYHKNSIHPLTRMPINPPQPQHNSMANQAMMMRLNHHQQQQHHFHQRQMLGNHFHNGHPVLPHQHIHQQKPTQEQLAQMNKINQMYRNFPNGQRHNPPEHPPHPLLRQNDRGFERRRNNSFTEGGTSEWEEWERSRSIDEYAGLMTPKQQGWLRNIQMMQLTTEDPYRDDYYNVMYRAKKRRTHPGEPLRIEGLERLLPLPKGSEKEASFTYTPPNMETSLGKLQVASVNAPRKIMDIDHVSKAADALPFNKRQQEAKAHRSTMMLLEQLYKQVMELDDLDRKISMMYDSPSRDQFIGSAKMLIDAMWDKMKSRMMAFLKVRKGKSLFNNLLHRLPYAKALEGFRFVLDNLPELTCSSDNQNSLQIIWPIADKILAHADADTLVDYAERLMPNLTSQDGLKTSTDSLKKDGVPCIFSTKFGITVIVALLVKGEKDHEKVVCNNTWQKFLTCVIDLFAAAPIPKAITDALVRDGATGEPQPVKVLVRGQSLSSLIGQKKPEGETKGRLTPPMPLLHVNAMNREAKDPSVHLARCTDHVHSPNLAAAQLALERLEISPKTDRLL